MKHLIIILIISLITHLVTAQTLITVKQDGTGDYTTIQQAVDVAVDGDTILIWPGVYIENVSINNKNIIVGSLTLTTGNTNYIGQTIIDGNNNGSCLEIRYCEDECIINGFTLKNGNGTSFGLLEGGGLFSKNSIIILRNCIIRDNTATGYGGGIYCHYSDMFISGTTIYNNHSYSRGGGIVLLVSTLEFDSINLCNIYLNYSPIGTDIHKLGSPPLHVIVDTFTVLEPDYYYLYSDIGGGHVGSDITYEINEGKIETSLQDLYVSPEGDNLNSGLTPDEPLKNISFALLKMASDSISPDTIHVANGIYTLSSGEKYPLSIKKNICIKGESRDSTILDAEDEIYLLHGIQYADNYHISNITLQHGNGDKNNPYGHGAFYINENRNSSLRNILFFENKGSSNSCGFISNSNGFILDNNIFKGNIGGGSLWVGHGNALEVYYDTINLYNCKFINNRPDYSIPPDQGGSGGGISIIGEYNIQDLMVCYLYNCLFIDNHTRQHPYGGMSQISMAIDQNANTYTINCTFGDNTSDNQLGGNIGIVYESNLSIYNSILYNNNPAELYMFTDEGNSNLNIYNSLVQGGEEDIRLYTSGNNVYYDYTNIDTDPLWDTACMYPYSLSAGSPCINTGTLNLPEGVVLPETDILGNPRIWDGFVDMGAYEYGPWVGIENQNSKFKIQNLKLLTVSPNPFTYSTQINYTASEKGKIQIFVYNIQGSKVTTLMDVTALPGSGEFSWDGKNDYGQKLPAGTYIINLIINDKIMESVKVMKK